MKNDRSNQDPIIVIDGVGRLCGGRGKDSGSANLDQVSNRDQSTAYHTVFQTRSARPHGNEISAQGSNPLSTSSAKLQSEESTKESSIRSTREMAHTSPYKKDTTELDREIIDLDPEVILDKDEIPYPGDVMTEEEFERWIAYQQQLQTQPKAFRQSRTRTICVRNRPIVPPLAILDTYQHGGLLLRPRVNVELRDGDFLRISYIIQNVSTDEVLLRGRLFRRLTFMNGTLEKKTNEVCWILHIDEDDTRSAEVQCLEEVKVDEVVKRRGLKLTNQNFPCLSWRDESNRFTETNDTVRNDRVLVCRWKYICSYANAAARKNNVHTQKALMRLREHESDSGCGIDDKILRRQWRGESVLGGASSLMSYEEAQRRRREKDVAQQAAERRSTSGSTPLITKKRSLPALADSGLRSKPIDLTIESDIQAGFYFIDLDAGDPEQISATSNSEKRRVASLSSPGVNSTIDIEPQEFGELSTPPSPTVSVSTVGKNEYRAIIDLTDGGEPESAGPQATENNITNFSDGLSAIGDLESGKTRSERREKGTHVQRYTFADAFCGCGGASRGATMAELHLKWAFDFARAMCRSYRRNFPTTQVYCTSADQFVMQKIMDIVVDILHISPPCNYFSPAHTTEGREDDQNTAASFVISELLKIILPRVVTLENTLGLERRHPLYLHAVLQQFTALGFSVAWKIIKLADYGIPQNRERLVIIAACPGEQLPDFPAPTHSRSPNQTGLKAWKTVNEALALIPMLWQNHRPRYLLNYSRTPFDGNTQAKCITTSGGQNNYHPSGRRPYTVRELACLQTLPLEHEFADECKTMLRKQIGNAVPPLFAKVLLEACKKSMMKADGVLEADGPSQANRARTNAWLNSTSL